jgi:hypothetical protein
MGYIDSIRRQVGAYIKLLQAPYDILKKVLEWCTSGEL